jgi:hypothetical protein
MVIYICPCKFCPDPIQYESNNCSKGKLILPVKTKKTEQQIHSMLPWFIPVIIILSLWDAVWKAIAMWKSARNNQDSSTDMLMWTVS